MSATRDQQIIAQIPRVRLLARKVCGDYIDQDYVASGYEALVRAVDSHSLVAGAKLSTHVGNHVRWALIDEIRRRTRTRTTAGESICTMPEMTRYNECPDRFDPNNPDNPDNRYSVIPEPPDHIDRIDRGDRVSRLLSILSERERDVVEAYYYEDMDMQEIADSMMGLTTGRVSQIISGAIKKMRESVNA